MASGYQIARGSIAFAAKARGGRLNTARGCRISNSVAVIVIEGAF